MQYNLILKIHATNEVWHLQSVGTLKNGFEEVVNAVWDKMVLKLKWLFNQCWPKEDALWHPTVIFTLSFKGKASRICSTPILVDRVPTNFPISQFLCSHPHIYGVLHFNFTGKIKDTKIYWRAFECGSWGLTQKSSIRWSWSWPGIPAGACESPTVLSIFKTVPYIVNPYSWEVETRLSPFYRQDVPCSKSLIW